MFTVGVPNPAIGVSNGTPTIRSLGRHTIWYLPLPSWRVSVWPPKPTGTEYSGRSSSQGLPKRSHSSARSTWPPLRITCSKMPNSYRIP